MGTSELPRFLARALQIDANRDPVFPAAPETHLLLFADLKVRRAKG